MTLSDPRTARHTPLDESTPAPDPAAEHTGLRPLGAVVGAAGGAAGGAAAGALGGIAAGPVGSLAGAMVGAVLGGAGGSAQGLGAGPSVKASPGTRPSGETTPPSSTITPSPRPRSPSADDLDNPPARYGRQAYATYRGACDWTDVEDELAAGWPEARGDSDIPWSEAAPVARAAWLRSRDAAKHTLSSDAPDEGLQYHTAERL